MLLKFLKTIFIILFIITLHQVINAQARWESMVLESDTWKYLAATSEPLSNWYQPGFNDAAWKSGQGGLGYGDNDDVTIVPACNSLYIRKQVVLPDVNIVEDLLLDIDYDDAFVLYINGVECARSSNITGTFPTYNATITTDREAQMYSGGKPERYQLKPSSLVRGINTFAVQILNQNISSSDLSARVFIHAKINYPNMVYNPTPSWFEEPLNFETSNLPLIFINTNGQTIIPDVKITADMKVLNSPTGKNNINDTNYEYNGKIGIEVRGFTSVNYPKKNYTVETRDAAGENLNVSLLGMPKENDWVFHGPYSDKSLMRNVLAYHLGNKTGKWSPRTRFFELYLNGNYVGVYVLVEKIKIDKNRLNLATLKETDVFGDQLTGGYILQIDRPDNDDVEGKDYWISPYRARTKLQQKVHFLFMDPKGSVINDFQRYYIQDYITAFEDAMNSENYKDRVTGYYPFIDLNSFVDYYIISELSRNLDGYRISTFLHKDKDSRGGKITMGPFWDYNICFGNANFFSAGNTQGWIIDGMGDGDAYAMPFWWEKFRLDPFFNSHIKKRWNYWIENYINETYLNKFIDSCALELYDAQKRNFKTWNVLGTYVWPNNYVGGTYQNELNYLKTWLRDRIKWMDSQIQPIVDVTLGKFDPEFRILDMVTYPNPFTENVNFKFYLHRAEEVTIKISDILGREITTYKSNLGEGVHQIPINITSSEESGKVFVYRLYTGNELRTTGKLVSF
jgi:hypothetical protein